MKILGTKAAGHRLARIKASPLWRNGAFENQHPILPKLKHQIKLPSLREFFFVKDGSPPAPLPSLDPRPAWVRPTTTGLRATWLGHSTVLLEIDGLRILTDPVWSERASPFASLGPKRFQPVPVALSALPPIDLVLISHDHYDHLDFAAIIALNKIGVTFVTSLGIGSHLEHWGVPNHRIIELDWWESYSLQYAELTVTATPAQHFSGRWPRARNDTLWSSFVVRGSKHSVFFSGDTGLTSEFEEVYRRLGRFDLLLLEIGSYHPYWASLHLGPEYALEALAMLGGGYLLPIHWGTFNLSTHPWDEPIERLFWGAAQQNIQLLTPRIGESVEPHEEKIPTTWWRSQ
jgi:L-ascorbate metabolism protein UlaG (beta-lactamase superfamily)